ncbi:diguanylate cyclase [Massilia aerilata]|uniref:diguanylate cyclase n=1 Tax=Massilia aerilata TaxID=453817 RepID=A0ABW0S3J7_9BURK
MRSKKNIEFAALAVVLVMALGAAVSYWMDRSTTVLVHELRMELEQQQRVDNILDALRDAETGQRGFIITGNEVFLEPWQHARQTLPAAIREAKDKAGSDVEQAKLWRIARLAELKLAELDETIAIRRGEGFAQTEKLVSSMRGKATMDELRRLVAARQARTDARRKVLRTEMLAASRRSFTVSLAATLINICVFGALLVVMARMLRERRETALQLEHKAAQLAGAVELGTRQNRELRIVAEMLRAVEAMPSSLDTGAVVARGFGKLLPGAGGTFFALDSGDAGTLRQLSRWGDASAQPSEMTLDDCWALQHRAHYKTSGCDGPSCAHYRSHGGDGKGGMRLCVPLVTHDELVGLVHLEGLAREADAREQQEQLAVTVAEQLALALGNARLRESLRRQSVLDPLTGLFNRRYFDETLRRELARSRRMASPLSLVVLDVDHFKCVNDGFGHAAGDAVLRAIAQLVRQSIRYCDVACRYGGEELVILMPDCAQPDAARRAEALRADIAGAPPMNDGAGPDAITASFGVAEFPLHGPDADSLFRAADQAMYRAKREGRNRVVLAAQP